MRCWVVCATFNGSRYLRELLRSLERQRLPVERVYFRDDGSNDGTPEIISDWARRTTIEVQIIEDNDHLGPAASFGRLLEQAYQDSRGYDDIAFFPCDQDDVWHHDKTARIMGVALARAAKGKPLLVHSDLVVTDSKLQKISGSLWSYQGIDPTRNRLSHLLLQNTVTGCACMMNRSLLKEMLPVPREAIMHDWWAALTASALGTIEVVRDPLVYYRQHGANDTGARRYNLWYALRRGVSLCSRSEFQKKLDIHISQAGAFMERFGLRLQEKDRRLLYTFVHLREMSWLARRKELVVNGILMKGFLRNGLLLACV